MKKLTKKELKLLEEEKRIKYSNRRNMINDLENFWKDVDAVTRVAIINEETEKLQYGNTLKNEEREKLLNRYERINNLSKNQMSVLRTLINNEYDERKEIAKEHLSKESIWISDIFWKEEDLKETVEFLKELGINKIYYTNHSTNALEVIIWLTKLEAKIIGTTNISEYNEGLIIELN